MFFINIPNKTFLRDVLTGFPQSLNPWCLKSATILIGSCSFFSLASFDSCQSDSGSFLWKLHLALGLSLGAESSSLSHTLCCSQSGSISSSGHRSPSKEALSRVMRGT